MLINVISQFQFFLVEKTWDLKLQFYYLVLDCIINYYGNIQGNQCKAEYFLLNMSISVSLYSWVENLK